MILVLPLFSKKIYFPRLFYFIYYIIKLKSRGQMSTIVGHNMSQFPSSFFPLHTPFLVFFLSFFFFFFYPCSSLSHYVLLPFSPSILLSTPLYKLLPLLTLFFYFNNKLLFLFILYYWYLLFIYKNLFSITYNSISTIFIIYLRILTHNEIINLTSSKKLAVVQLFTHLCHLASSFVNFFFIKKTIIYKKNSSHSKSSLSLTPSLFLFFPFPSSLHNPPSLFVDLVFGGGGGYDGFWRWWVVVFGRWFCVLWHDGGGSWWWFKAGQWWWFKALEWRCLPVVMGHGGCGKLPCSFFFSNSFFSLYCHSLSSYVWWVLGFGILKLA